MDNHTNTTMDLSRLEMLLEQILLSLRQAEASIQIGGHVHDTVIVQGNHNTVKVVRSDLEFLDELQSKASINRRQEIYLARLVLSDICAPWERLYVPLAGMVDIRQALEGLPTSFTEFVVPLEGRESSKQTTMKPLKDITDAMQNHQAFIILGAPGAGKSTTQQKIAFDAARAIQTSSAEIPRIPLFVRLSEQRDLDPYTFLQTEWERRVSTPFNIALKAGRILLLADGVNEIPRHDRMEHFKAWRHFISDYRGNNQLIFSGRFLDYDDGLEIPRVLVEPLDKNRIADFLKQHQAEGLATMLEDPNKKLIDLADNPLNLLILTIVYRMDPYQNFENRGELFHAFVHSLLKRESKNHSPDVPEAAIKQALSQIAFVMQEQGEGLTFKLEKARKALPAKVDVDGEEYQINPARIFSFGHGATLLDPAAIPDVRFRHHVLQEYFAALELLRRFEAGEDLNNLWRTERDVDEMPQTNNAGEWDPLPEPPSTGWEVTTILAYGLTKTPEKFIDSVRLVNSALSARCINEAGITPSDETIEKIRSDLLSDLYNYRLHLRTRMQAGFLLGKIGDPRFPKNAVNGTQVILPSLVDVSSLPGFRIGKWPITRAEFDCFVMDQGYQKKNFWSGARANEWLEGKSIFGGQMATRMQIWKKLKNNSNWRNDYLEKGYSPEKIKRLEHIASLSLDELILEAEQELPQKPRDEPAFWSNPRLNNPSQPVVGITWFEAKAYCLWLSQVLNRNFSLPSEYEWEISANGAKKNIYPWGDTWDFLKANTLESRISKPSPVGLFAAAGGINAFGIEDQAGNVWEWTLDENQDDDSSIIYIAIKGGAWYLDSQFCQCSSRELYVADNFSGNLGFRICERF